MAQKKRATSQTSRTRNRTAKIQRALLRIDGKPVEIILRTNPRAHRFIVRVDPSTGVVSVVAPSSRSLERALGFARKERDWIATRLANVPKPVPLALGHKVMYRGNVHLLREGRGRRPVWIDAEAEAPAIRVHGRAEHATRRVLDWLKREAKRRISEKAAEYAAQLGVKYQRITIRDTSSRWGSCSTAKCLSFSWRLIMAPPHVLDYVVAHEVAHLREMNHAPRFWRAGGRTDRPFERSQGWLSENGAHAAPLCAALPDRAAARRLTRGPNLEQRVQHVLELVDQILVLVAGLDLRDLRLGGRGRRLGQERRPQRLHRQALMRLGHEGLKDARRQAAAGGAVHRLVARRCRSRRRRRDRG